MLHTTGKMRGVHILATDGEIGHVDDLLIDERTWSVRYLVVDTSILQELTPLSAPAQI